MAATPPKWSSILLFTGSKKVKKDCCTCCIYKSRLAGVSVKLWLGAEIKMKASPVKSLPVKVNLVVLAFIFLVYIALVFPPPPEADEKNSAPPLAGDVQMLEEPQEEIPTFLREINNEARIALVNLDDTEKLPWRLIGLPTVIRFESLPATLQWRSLFPEWIDEEKDTCPNIPMPDFSAYGEFAVIAAKLPCGHRDVHRLQVHLVTANSAVRLAAKDEKGRAKMAFFTSCRPMPELFRPEEMAAREGDWWLYEFDIERLKKKVAMPVGSCELAPPALASSDYRREAYATVLHSSSAYVCGALMLAKSLIKTNTLRDLVLLHDDSISAGKLRALAAAGWSLRRIERIRNPKAVKGSYNEYNYSKLRLWQLTDYQKVVFVDSDVLVLRNLDRLFRLPELSATGNSIHQFNSGIMVIEPSNLTFQLFLEIMPGVVSDNGGDQGFLNEMFTWWHRLLRKVNFVKNFWSNTTEEREEKEALFGADPPELDAIHYLGWKPWLCYRDYDCNWNVGENRAFASDVAHRRWWVAHDEMARELQPFCGLSRRRKAGLRREMRMAREAGFGDGHWRLEIQDRRKYEI